MFLSGPVLTHLYTACSTQMYVPNTLNAPLLKEKNEVQATVTPNDVQVAVGLGDNFALMANGFYRYYAGNDGYRHSGVLGEAALGYLTPLENNFVLEAYAGAGLGQVRKQQEFTDANNLRYLARFQANAVKAFVQPNFGIKTALLDVVVSGRVSAVKYTSFSPENYPVHALRADYLEEAQLTRPLFLFAEPAITLRAGFNYLKVQAQFGLTLNLTGQPIRHPDRFSSIGLVLDLARWYRPDKARR